MDSMKATIKPKKTTAEVSNALHNFAYESSVDSVRFKRQAEIKMKQKTGTNRANAALNMNSDINMYIDISIDQRDESPMSENNLPISKKIAVNTLSMANHTGARNATDSSGQYTQNIENNANANTGNPQHTTFFGLTP
jgi:hypothetical protein